MFIIYVNCSHCSRESINVSRSQLRLPPTLQIYLANKNQWIIHGVTRRVKNTHNWIMKIDARNIEKCVWFAKRNCLFNELVNTHLSEIKIRFIKQFRAGNWSIILDGTIKTQFKCPVVLKLDNEFALLPTLLFTLRIMPLVCKQKSFTIFSGVVLITRTPTHKYKLYLSS